MKIRQYKQEDCDAISKLFFETVHTVNASDYTAEQLYAWAASRESLKAHNDGLLKQNTLIAEKNGIIVGFGSIDKTGCLDFLFVHKDYQKQKVATVLCDELEKEFTVIKTYASVTAKPFFEKRGYIVTKSQEAERLGVKLKNYEMQKTQN